jgi:shikimate kinase
MFTHIALVGLMASGKSAVGQVLADELGVPLVDVDDTIQARVGRSVRELWIEGGEGAYRPLEREVVLGALAPGHPCVLAAPGGVAVDEVAAEAIAQPHVAVVYLRADPGVLAERIRADPQERPLVGVDPEAVLAEQLRARDDRYRALADRVEEIAGRDAADIAAVVLDAFDGFPGVRGGSEEASGRARVGTHGERGEPSST